MTITESTVESLALTWLQSLGYAYKTNEEIARINSFTGIEDYSQTILTQPLHDALTALNPHLNSNAIDDVVKKLQFSGTQDLFADNWFLHQMMVNEVDVDCAQSDGSIRHDKAKIIDFDNIDRNLFWVVQQFTVKENKSHRRADIVLFVNGLPLVVMELKNAASETATVRSAFQQLQIYKKEIPCLFRCNALLIASDGIQARAGSLTADFERFSPWRTVDGINLAHKGEPELETLVKGLLDPKILLDVIKHFIVIENHKDRIVKKVAAYHQYHAVNKALSCTLKASSPSGDKKIGVIWHTQGSGKSISMAFYAGKVISAPQMENPTIVVLTDRNDLDEQLFTTFSNAQALLRQRPVRAENRRDLKQLLSVAAGGVIFTTIQKYAPESGESYPLLSSRRNIIVIADEAHRSQYDFMDGFARHLRDALPNAAFIGFTGTPIEFADKDTYAVFGENIHTYNIQQAVEDGATVPIYYESRLAKVMLDESERPFIDATFDEVTEDEENNQRDKLKSKWARLEVLIGSEDRIHLIAKDIVDHFERRQEALQGKGMIVCMSRPICAALYAAIVKLKPQWHSEDDDKGAIKVVMTGNASDPEALQPHIRNKKAREDLADRARDPNDPLKLVIVRDMWLTGFDAPCMHTMYVDKPMQGHNLMQAIARVNRVFKDKPGGLVVDYLGIADSLKKALAQYTDTDREQTAIPQDQAIAMLLEKHEVIKGLFYSFDYKSLLRKTPEEKFYALPLVLDHIVSQEDGRARFMQAVSSLSKAFALVPTTDDAMAIRDEVAFFQQVRSALAKTTANKNGATDDLDTALHQLLSRAISSTEVIDIFSAAGLKTPNISILSDDFLAEMRGLKTKNLAREMLEKLLRDEIKTRTKKNVVQAKKFSEMLDNVIKKYQGRLIESSAIIEELIQLAKEMQEAKSRGEALGLNEDEDAFYEALADNKSAREVLGDEKLKLIARELVIDVKKNTTIDWVVKESVRANIRLVIKRILKKYGYPPDFESQAIDTVLAQAQLLSEAWEDKK